MPRQHDRVPFLTGIILEFASGRAEARVSDISMGGCFIDTITDARPGEQVRFELVEDNGTRLSFTGKVAYHFEGVGFGVIFTDLDEDQRQFLRRIVETKQT